MDTRPADPSPHRRWRSCLGTFRMGSNKHYPEEAPVHQVRVDAFWVDRTPVTNRQFKKFIGATGHVTVAEIPPDPKDYPGALPHMLYAGSLVFTPPSHAVDLRNWSIGGASQGCKLAASLRPRLARVGPVAPQCLAILLVGVGLCGDPFDRRSHHGAQRASAVKATAVRCRKESNPSAPLILIALRCCRYGCRRNGSARSLDRRQDRGGNL